MMPTTAVCRNPGCPWQDEPRRADWPRPGWGMRVAGVLVCTCGWYMELVPDPETKTPLPWFVYYRNLP